MLFTLNLCYKRSKKQRINTKENVIAKKVWNRVKRRGTNSKERTIKTKENIIAKSMEWCTK